MIGLTEFADWSVRRKSAAFKRSGVIAAPAPDKPANLINRRREIFPDLFLEFSFSDE